VKRTVFYQGKRYDIRPQMQLISIWQGTIITPESGAKHTFYNH
jgi:hypothetical protein